ncbi:SHD1 domain-containing protein [Anatilimnocola sp. NA78]|uniref:SHD1 domain-containing protein n=1 Tax=Anatilimnocola sp. NA78 TaxID=3415683 RepID=UPI003CE595AE
MATIKLNRMAAETGQLPAVCLCCGKPAAHRVKNQFYLRSTGIMIAMMFLGWPWRLLLLPQAYESVTIYVPMCGTHRYRLSWHNWMMILVAIGAIIVVPLLIAGNYVESDSVKFLAQMLTLVLALGVMGAGLVFLFLWITAPRLIDYSGMAITLTSVSYDFAQAVRPAAPPPMPASAYGTLPPHLKQQVAKPVNWKLFGIIGGSIAGGMVVLMLMCAGFAAFAGRGAARNAIAQNNHEAEFRRQIAEQEAQMARFQAESEARRRAMQIPGPPSASPTLPGPPSLPGPPAPLAPPPMNAPSFNEPPSVPADPPSIPAPAFVPPAPSFGEPPMPPLTPGPSSPIPSAPESSIPELRRPDIGRPATGQPGAGGPSMNGPGFPITDVSQVKPRDRVFIFWVSRWYPGYVIETSADQIKVHYDQHSDSWDAFVSLDKVRSMRPIRATPSKPEVAKPAEAPAETTVSSNTRIWTDSTGQFTIDAELIGFEDGAAKLKRKDGKVVSLPLDKLSGADQAAVRAAYPP